MSSPNDLAAAIDALVDEYRLRCLWSLRPDYYPRTPSEQLRALATIERHGDLAAYRHAASLRQWLLRVSNEPSAD